ncbi:MAG: D-ribose ABC transporter substrate-binding protein [Spirochaetia bacterium]
MFLFSVNAFGDNKTIAVITASLDNPFFVTMAQSAKAEVEKLGYDAWVVSHNDNVGTQNQLFDTAIAKHVAAIIVENAGADASVAPFQRAKAAGIPIFCVDREVSAKGLAVATLVSNNFQGATMGAVYFAQLMGEKGNYVELTGHASDNPAHVRSDGFHSILDKFPGMKMVAQQTANWNQTEAYNVMQTILQAHPDIKGVICGNDTMALGAEAALLAAGRGEVIVGGFDASPDAATSIQKGQMKYTVLQAIGKLSEMAVDQADRYLKTGSTGQPENQSVNCVLITPKNVGRLKNFALVGP